MDGSFEDMYASYAKALSGRSREAVEAHPENDATRWNARQIVEHLVLTYRSSSAVLRQRLEKNRPTLTKVLWKQLAPRLTLLGVGFMPSGKPSPATVAETLLDGAMLAELLRVELQKMDEALTTCEARFGRQPMATHTVLGPLSAGQWRRFHFVHGRHHLKQLRRLVKR